MKYRTGIRILTLVMLAVMLLCPVQILAAEGLSGVKTDLTDGEYSIQVDLEGGSGKARRRQGICPDSVEQFQL